MATDSDISPSRVLRTRYQEALAASGLVDGVVDVLALDARPYRYLEGEFVCRHGDAAESLWVIVSGSVAVREESRTLFVRTRNEVVGEQNLLGDGFDRWYDLVVSESQAEVLKIDKTSIENHPQADVLWRNVAKIISLKLKDASTRTLRQSRQLDDDNRILRAYTNEYALSRRLQSGAGHLTDYRVDRAVVWFSDVVEFSRHMKDLAPPDAADLVQRLFNAQTAPITLHNGHIDKFIGDGLMAFWVVSKGEPARTKCVDALMAAEEAVSEVAQIWIGKIPLQLRIGLHIGLVLSGDFGSTTRHQFTLIGPEVNKAARLEQARSGDVIEGDRTLGPIRLSTELREELDDLNRQRYQNTAKIKAKNLGEIELFC